MKKNRTKKLELSSKGYFIKRTELQVLPYCTFMDDCNSPMYYRPEDEIWLNGLNMLELEEKANKPKTERQILQLGYIIINPIDDKPIKIRGKVVIFNEVDKLQDLSADKNGNVMLKARLTDDENEKDSFYVLLDGNGRFIDISSKPIKVADKNFYKGVVSNMPATYYYFQTKNNGENNTSVKLLQSTKDKNCALLLTGTTNYYNYLDGAVNGVKYATSQPQCQTTNFYNGYAYGKVGNAKLSRDLKTGYLKSTDQLLPTITAYIDKFGNSYLDFKSLVEADCKRRKTNQKPIIEDLSLLKNDIIAELNAIQLEVEKIFKGQDIGKTNRQNFETKTRNLASKYDKAQIYLNKILDIIEISSEWGTDC